MFFAALGGAAVLGLTLGAWFAIQAVRLRDGLAARRAGWLGIVSAAGTLSLLATALYWIDTTPDVATVRLAALGLALAAAVAATGIACGWSAGEGARHAASTAIALLAAAAATAVMLREAGLRWRVNRIAGAVSAGRADVVTREMASGGLGRAIRRRPLLLLSAAGGNVETLEALLAAGIDPGDPANRAGEALIAAAHGGHVEAVRLLLSRGVDPNAAASAQVDRHRKRRLPAFMAWAGVPAPVLDVLRAAGARDVDVFTEKRAALHAAALAGDVARFRELEKEEIFGMEVLAAEIDEAVKADLVEFVVAMGGGERSLFAAARTGATRTFQRILPTCRKPYQRQEALGLAAREGHLAVVTLVVEGEEARERALQDPSSRHVDLPISLDEKGVDGRTPVENAARGGHADVVAYLLSHGAAREPRLLADPEVRRHPGVVSLLETR